MRILDFAPDVGEWARLNFGPADLGDARRLAFSPDGSRLLGLIHQQVFVRRPAPPGESAAARKRRQGRESLAWAGNIAAVSTGRRRGPSGSMSATAAPATTRRWRPPWPPATISSSASAWAARCSPRPNTAGRST